MNTAPKLTVMSDSRFASGARDAGHRSALGREDLQQRHPALLPVNLTINQGVCYSCSALPVAVRAPC